jgi:cytochrome c-type biogenesis protein
MAVETSVLVSALAGLGSFLSPCILPILPGFISYLSGTAANEAKKSETTTTEIGNTTISSGGRQSLTVKRISRLNIFLNTVYFVLGFSLVFAILGVILNSVLATTVGNGLQHSLTTVGGIVIIGFGVYLVLSTKLRTLNFEKKMTKLPRQVISLHLYLELHLPRAGLHVLDQFWEAPLH